MGVSSALGVSALFPAGFGFRNVLINGEMQVAQRGTSTASITTGGYYTADRWLNNTDGTFGTWTQSVENDAPTGSGFRKSLKMLCSTVNSTLDASDFLTVEQRLEGQNIQQFLKGTAAAKQFSLSFWVKSNVTGTYIAELRDVTNSRTVSASYTISASGAWENKTITFPADTTGAFANDNSGALRVAFGLVMGSTYAGGTLATTWAATVTANRFAGQTNLAAATNNYWQITGVQLEANVQPTPFEHRPIGVELALCQRYFCTVADGALATNDHVGLTYYYQAGFLVARCSFPVSMRSKSITLVSTSGTNYYVNYSNNNGGDTFNSWLFNVSNLTEALIYNGSEVSGTSGYAGDCRLNNALAKISFSAEL